MAIINDISQNFSCGNAVPTQFLMWERRSHAFPPHYTTGPPNRILIWRLAIILIFFFAALKISDFTGFFNI